MVMMRVDLRNNQFLDGNLSVLAILAFMTKMIVSHLESKASEFDSHHYRESRMCFILLLFLLEFLRQWIDFHSIITDALYNTTLFVLLLFCEAMNLTSTSSKRNNVIIKLKLKIQRKNEE